LTSGATPNSISVGAKRANREKLGKRKGVGGRGREGRREGDTPIFFTRIDATGQAAVSMEAS